MVFLQISWRKGFEDSRYYLYLFVFKAFSLEPLAQTDEPYYIVNKLSLL